jgi:hypothetical protein
VVAWELAALAEALLGDLPTGAAVTVRQVVIPAPKQAADQAVPVVPAQTVVPGTVVREVVVGVAAPPAVVGWLGFITETLGSSAYLDLPHRQFA